MNTHGVGIHPDEWALQPLGTRTYRFPLCAHRDGERVDPHGIVPSAIDGY